MTTKEKINAELLANAIVDNIDRLDKNLSYEVLAKAISIVIKNEYGSHNVPKFLGELHSNFNQ